MLRAIATVSSSGSATSSCYYGKRLFLGPLLLTCNRGRSSAATTASSSSWCAINTHHHQRAITTTTPSFRQTSSSSWVVPPSRRGNERNVIDNIMIGGSYHGHSLLLPLVHLRSNDNMKLLRSESMRCFHSSAQFLEATTAASPSSSSSASAASSSRRRKKKKKKKKKGAKKPVESNTNQSGNSITGKKRMSRGGNNKKPKIKSKPEEVYQHRTHGETGRPIMTKELLDDMLLSSPQLSLLPKDVVFDNAKSWIHKAQSKMLFHQKYEHVAEGPQHDKLFFATLRTTVDTRSTDDIANDTTTTATSTTATTTTTANTIELVTTGAARSKKRAETLAASDLIANFAELGIDIRNPPDLAKMKKTLTEERFKSNVQRAQMILEVLNVSWPTFETLEQHASSSSSGKSGKKQLMGYVSNVRFYCRGAPISSSSEELGRSKAEAEGRALLAATAPGSVLEEFVGVRKMDELRDLIESSPAGHVAALHVPPLPDEALDVLANAMGSYADHVERMEMHAERKVWYEQEFHERRMRRQRQKNNSSGVGRVEWGGDGGAFRDKSRNDTMAQINETFAREEQSRREKADANPEGKQGQMKIIRDALPIKAIRDDLIDALKSQQVVVVSGGTGSGKSTQCPQYILEDAIFNEKGADTRIVVTQPRRIAAISVAERIADERDEAIGNSVGYTVRFNRRTPREAGASVEFLTTGVLLRRLVNDPSLDGVSHVMIDEVHERDIDTDFLLVLLRDLLTKRPELRVILMSATLDADSFGAYFSSGRDEKEMGSSRRTPVPVMSVPTKPRHPVEVVHLEDMTCEGGTANPTAIPTDIQDIAQSLLRLHDQQLQLELEEAVAEESAASRLEARSIAEDEGKITLDSDDEGSDSDSDTDDSDYGGDESVRSSSPSTRLEALRRAVSMRIGSTREETVQSSRTRNHLTMSDKREIGEITTKLLAKLAQHVAQVETDAGRKGSILCFLPGLDEIKEAMAILGDETDRSLRARMKVLPLHSTIPQDDQQKVFIPAADGTVKVILATNIAESSVTIDDVLCVIDGGLVRELNWDAEKSMSTMVTVPTSKASATQRLGRAGRVAPGKCYRIYSRGQHTAMLERPMPEIQRTALEATCLNTCTMTNDSVETFLSRAMDPPKEEAVAYAMERLKKLGAISVDPSSTTAGETLSPLGHCLSRLPLDPATGRMLIMGCVMQCLDPVLTAAACFSSREVFFTPPGLRQAQRKARQTFSEHSDIMASVRAYDEYQDILREEGWDVARQWASDNFISIHALTSVHSVRSQLINELNRIGLVHKNDLARSYGRNQQLRRDASVNRNAGTVSLYSAVWAGGIPDNLAARRQLGSFGTLRSRTENHAGLHPSSVAFHRKPPKQRQQLPLWFVYREMVLSSQVFLRGCTALKPEQILLCGGYELKSNGDQARGQRVLDDWIIVEGQCDDTLGVLSTARSEINAALDLKVMNPRKPLPEVQQSIIDAVCDCFDVLDETD
ncbi:hypothetical protein ACHAXR_010394 [Thalassiosira sp. AJA248-18]